MLIPTDSYEMALILILATAPLGCIRGIKIYIQIYSINLLHISSIELHGHDTCIISHIRTSTDMTH